MAGRLALRRWKWSRLYVDDYLCALAATFFIAFLVILLLYLPIENDAQLFNLGLQEQAPSTQQLSFAARMNVITSVIFWLVIYTAKASFLGFLWRSLGGAGEFRKILIVGTVFLGLSSGITILSGLWQCGAPSKFGDFGTLSNPSLVSLILNSTDACGTSDRSLAVRLLSISCTLDAMGWLFCKLLYVSL